MCVINKVHMFYFEVIVSHSYRRFSKYFPLRTLHDVFLYLQTSSASTNWATSFTSLCSTSAWPRWPWRPVWPSAARPSTTATSPSSSRRDASAPKVWYAVSVIHYYIFFVSILCFAGAVDLSNTAKANFLPILLYSSWECWHNNEKISMASCFKRSTGSKTWTQDYLVTSSLYWQCWPLEHHQLSIMKQ